jgi:hypothetical protein
MRSRNIRLIFIFVVISVVIGFFIAPGHREIAMMRLEDNNFRDAFKYYKEQSSQGEKSINVVAPLVKIYIHYGRVDKAIALLEGYVAKNPKSVEGRKQLTALYKSA